MKPTTLVLSVSHHQLDLQNPVVLCCSVSPVYLYLLHQLVDVLLVSSVLVLLQPLLKPYLLLRCTLLSFSLLPPGLFLYRERQKHSRLHEIHFLKYCGAIVIVYLCHLLSFAQLQR